MTVEESRLSHPKYRPDIDGLRAIAVLAVVAFHAFPNYVKGGFIGVDVFFVISGYLISTIIFNSLETNTFSFKEFYARRIKRILPALIVVLIASFTFGWFVLFTDEYKQLGKHIVGAATYTNNFMFWQENGYFDGSAETKPLLHLWSLSIEEQFYIIWPFLLWFCYKYRFNLLTFTSLLAFISFALHLHMLHIDKVAAFYAPQLRMWELLIGALVAYLTLFPKPYIQSYTSKLDARLNKIIFSVKQVNDGSTLRNVQSILGLLLIVLGLTFITKQKYFPGWWAMLSPVLGSALIVSATQKAWLNRGVLSNKILVWFGLISYPLYLWHWPLLSFAHIIESDTPSHEIRVIAVLISIALAAITYYAIENPIRLKIKKKYTTLTLILMMAVFGIAGYQTYKKDGVKKRFANQVVSINSFEHTYKQKCNSITNEEYPDDWCNVGTSANEKPKIILIGDSFSNAYSNMFNAYAKIDSNLPSFVQFGRGQCPSLLDYGPEYCKKITNDIFNYINTNKEINTVVLSANWSDYTNGKDFNWVNYKESADSFRYAFDKTLTKLKEMNKKIIVLFAVPQGGGNPKACIVRAIRFTNNNYNNKCNYPLQNATNSDNSKTYLIPKLSSLGVNYFDPFSYFCDNSICKMIDGNKILSTDGGHMSYFGGEFLAIHAHSEIESLFTK